MLKLYQRKIRPMVIPPCLQGMNDKPYPLYSADIWMNEEFEGSLKNEWEKSVKERDSWGRLGIDEKYEEIELPQPDFKNIKDSNFVCFLVDTDKIDMDIAVEYVQRIAKVLPNNVEIAILPNMTINILDKDAANDYIKAYKKAVGEKYE